MSLMTLGLIGKKLGMTQIFDQNGVLIPVTIIEAGPCPILNKKEDEKDGYRALKLGFEKKPERKVKKPDAGIFKKLGLTPLRIIREFRVDDISEFNVGDSLDVSIFDEGERVNVTGISKGRGFSGTVRRHGTHRGPETHGSKYHRAPGSLGGSSDPSRVFKGKRMPGQYGNRRCTALNLKVVTTDKEKNILLIKGSVPGHANGYLLIRKKQKKAAKAAKR